MNVPALRLLAAAALLPFALLAGCMSYISDPAGSNLDLRGSLNGASETPPNTSPASGSLTAQYSTVTRILKWRLVVNGLSGPVTRAAFHGPDGVDEDAAIAAINQPFEGDTHIGATTLTPSQAADLLAGHWYVDLQTEKYPGGEIRGAVQTSR